MGRAYRMELKSERPYQPPLLVVLGITERPDGELIWCLIDTCPDHGADLINALATDLRGSPVTEKQAESITGLSAPVCWDRLRELVQESEGT